MDQIKQLTYNELQRRLKLKALADYDYLDERTLVVVSGMNTDKFSLEHVKGLKYYEERMLFFLFLLRNKKTKIIYLTSKKFDTSLFDYYLGLIFKDSRIKEIKKRLTHIEVSGKDDEPLTKKILASKTAICQITKNIDNPKTAMIRCYKPTPDERKLSVKLQIPLFAPKSEFDFAGTKSGSRKIFKLANVNQIPGINFIKNYNELVLAMARLMKDYPYYDKLIVKLDESASGRGNAVFHVYDFVEEQNIDIDKNTNVEELAKKIKKHFSKHIYFQLPGETAESYIKQFNKGGGIVELFIRGEIKYSPSTRILVTADGVAKVLSAHEQILGGPDSQKYMGSAFPAKFSHRKAIIKESQKIANWMAKKGIVGNFSVDFVVVYDKEGNLKKIYSIEINLRKIGSTNPFVTTRYLTRAKYNQSKGTLEFGNTPIHYISMDFNESEEYKDLNPEELIKLVNGSKVGYNAVERKGIVVYMPGHLKDYGRFGSLCIGHSDEEAGKLHKSMLKLISNHISKKVQ